MLINKYESAGLKHFEDSKAINEYLNGMDDTYENLDECNSNKKCKILIIFKGMIADMLNN